MYVVCNKGGDPGLSVASTASTATTAGPTSLATSSACTLAACSAMAGECLPGGRHLANDIPEPYTSLGVTTT